MEAFLYAAGRGFRLGALAHECPKILLSVGGKSLLERHAELLALAGVSRLYVVTGHLRDSVAAAMGDVSKRAGIPVVEVFNEGFLEGSVISMAASLPQIRACKGPALIMDGDVLYDHRLLGRLVQSNQPNVLLIDRGYSTVDDDPVLVPVRGGRPVEFRKKWTGEADFVGESIGFFKLDPAGLGHLVRETEARLGGERRKESYDEVLRSLVLADRFGYEDVTGIPWTEIDFPGDLDYARDVILPRLEPIHGRR